MAKKEVERLSDKVIRFLRIAILIAVLLFIFFAFLSCAALPALLFGEELSQPGGNIAHIKIRGLITVDGVGRYGSGGTSSTRLVKLIKLAEENPSIQAIILDINSGGGTAVASAEVMIAVQKAKKPVVAVIREVGASGAYWVASAADRIFVNPLSITGSIGVFGSYLEFSGLMEDFNVSYVRLVAGKFKDIGSPFRALTDEERVILEAKLGQMHTFLINSVANNRGMSPEKVKGLANGLYYLGTEAMEFGLIDEAGGLDDAIAYLEELLGIKAEVAKYRVAPSFLEVVSDVTSQKPFDVQNDYGLDLK